MPMSIVAVIFRPETHFFRQLTVYFSKQADDGLDLSRPSSRCRDVCPAADYTFLDLVDLIEERKTKPRDFCALRVATRLGIAGIQP